MSRKYTGGTRDRTWHPDFFLSDLGFFIEYAGISGDEAYEKGVARKKKIYEQMGIPVLWLYPEDLWTLYGSRGKMTLRQDVAKHILRTVYETATSQGFNNPRSDNSSFW